MDTDEGLRASSNCSSKSSASKRNQLLSRHEQAVVSPPTLHVHNWANSLLKHNVRRCSQGVFESSELCLVSCEPTYASACWLREQPNTDDMCNTAKIISRQHPSISAKVVPLCRLFKPKEDEVTIRQQCEWRRQQQHRALRRPYGQAKLRLAIEMITVTFILSIALLVTPGLCNHQDAVHITAILGESVVFNCHVEFPDQHPVPYVLQWEKKVGDTVRYRAAPEQAIDPTSLLSVRELKSRASLNAKGVFLVPVNSAAAQLLPERVRQKLSRQWLKLATGEDVGFLVRAFCPVRRCHSFLHFRSSIH
ncbi:hypothetical protein TKK_0010132 [Trichogramma kaykai]